MINIGEVYCTWCGDAFEPEGLPSFGGPNFCSDDCEDMSEAVREGREAYNEARYGSAPLF
jgi:hypothetical protein